MPIVKTTDGKLYRVEVEQEISQEELNNEVAHLQAKLSELEALITPVQPAASEATPTETQNESAPVSTPAEQPAQDTPVNQPAEAPATDPDPSAVQPDPNSVNLS